MAKKETACSGGWGQPGGTCRQVAVVVEKFIGEGAAVPKELGYRRVVAVGDLGGVPVEKQLHQHPPQDGAVTEDGDGFLREPGGGRFHAPDEAGGIFMEALGALQLPGDRVPAEAGDGFGFYPLQVAERQILPPAQTDLPKCRVPIQGQTLRQVDRPGGETGPASTGIS